MRAFVIRRLLQAVLVIFLVVTLVFFLIRVSGDPASLGVNLDPNRTAEEIKEEYEEIRRKMGLDKHPVIQYVVFWQRTLQLDFGNSFPLRRAHHDGDLRAAAQNSLRLGGAAMVLGIALGLPLGIIAALRRGTMIDTAATMGAVLGIVTPQFFSGDRPHPHLFGPTQAFAHVRRQHLEAHHPARGHSFDRPDRHGRPHRPFRDARGARPGLRAHGPRQGPG